MARSDLLLNLVRAGAVGDQLGLRRTLEAMIAEERGKQHHAMAERLAEHLSARPRPTAAEAPPGSFGLPTTARALTGAVSVIQRGDSALRLNVHFTEGESSTEPRTCSRWRLRARCARR